MKKIIVILLVILELGVISFIGFKPLLNSKHIVTEDINKEQMLAIMLEQTPGLNDYMEMKEGEFPGSEYTFNSEKSNCVDTDGNILPDALEYNSLTKKAIVKTHVTTYCYLYFDLVS